MEKSKSEILYIIDILTQVLRVTSNQEELYILVSEKLTEYIKKL